MQKAILAIDSDNRIYYAMRAGGRRDRQVESGFHHSRRDRPHQHIHLQSR